MCRKPLIQMLAAVSIILLSSDIHAEWTRFRGPNGDGVSTETHSLPTHWNRTPKAAGQLPAPSSMRICSLLRPALRAKPW